MLYVRVIVSPVQLLNQLEDFCEICYSAVTPLEANRDLSQEVTLVFVFEK
jgi:hypothetical protein